MSNTNYKFNNNGITYDLNNIFLSSLVTLEPVNRASIPAPTNNNWNQLVNTTGEYIQIFNSSNKPGYYIVNISLRSTNFTNSNTTTFDYCIGTINPQLNFDIDPTIYIGSSGKFGANNVYPGYFSYGSQLVGIVYYNGTTNWNVYIRKNGSDTSTFTYTTNCIIGPLFPYISNSGLYGSITNYSTNIGGTNYDLNKLFLSGSLTYSTTSLYQDNRYDNYWFTIEDPVVIPNNTAGYYMMYLSIVPSNGNSDTKRYYAVVSNTGTGPIGTSTSPYATSNCVSLTNLLGGNGTYNYLKSTSNLIYHNGVNNWYIYTKIIASDNSTFSYNISLIGPLTPYSS